MLQVFMAHLWVYLGNPHLAFQPQICEAADSSGSLDEEKCSKPQKLARTPREAVIGRSFLGGVRFGMAKLVDDYFRSIWDYIGCRFYDDEIYNYLINGA